MKYTIFILICFCTISRIVFSQTNNKHELYKVFTYKCFSRIDSVKLPIDLIGPKYFYYGEGTIVSFISSDSITISILCGADAALVLDSLYLLIDSIQFNGRVITNRYLNKEKKLYARKDYFNDFEILYEDVPFQRKNEFDMAFDMLRDCKQKKK